MILMKRPQLVILFCVTAAAAAAQSPEAGPAFEVAAVRATSPADRAPVEVGNATYPSGRVRDEGGPGTPSPGQWTCANMDLSTLIVRAWDLDSRQLANPSSLADARYDIVAKIPPNTSRGDFNLMIRRLLIERIGLAIHHEQKEISVQELTVAKSGLKMKAAEPAPADASAVTPRLTWDRDGNPQLPPGRPMLIRPARAEGFVYAGRMQSISDLAKALPGPGGELVVDKTGLTGKYDFVLKFGFPVIAAQMAQRSAAETAPGVSVPEPGESWPPLNSALVEQLGLQLQRAKAVIDVLVVDHFNKTPTEN